MVLLPRRKFLIQTGALMGAGLLCPPKLVSAATALKSKQLHLYNVHTGEFYKGEYSNGTHIFPEAHAELNHFLRDWRTDETHPMDPELIHLIHDLQTQWGTAQAFDLISGYRSPQTNAALRKKSKGVAKRSRHLDGMAVDIASKNRLQNLRNLAQSLKRGGVGYYPQKGFVHVDIRSKPTFW